MIEEPNHLPPEPLSTHQEVQNRRLLRSTLSMTLPTVLSRILGYIRDMLQAKFLGTGKGMDAFIIASLIPNLFRRLTAEGAMTAAFIPVFAQEKKDRSRDELWTFANVFFFDLTLILTVLTVLGIVFAPLLVKIISPGYGRVPGKWELTIALTKIMFPYIFLISLAALAMAILNSFKKFVIPAFTPVLFNLSIITAALLFAENAGEPAYIFAAGIVLGGLLQLSIQIPFLRRQGMTFKFGLSFRHPAVKKVAKLIIPGIFGAGIYQINIVISRMIATSLQDGSVSSLYYASRIEELTLGLFAIALSIALFPTLSDLAARKDIEGMKKTLKFSFKLIFLITFPAMAGLIVLNQPIIQVLFQRGAFDAQSTAMSSWCLLFFAFGLPFISGTKILAPMFFSLKDTKTPVIVAFFVMMSYIGFSLILMGPLRAGGIALALSLSSLINFVALFFLLEKKLGKIEKKDLFISAFKSALSAVVMAGAVWIFMKQFDFEKLVFIEKTSVVLAVILGGVIIYLIMNLLFKHEDLKSLKQAFSKDKILHDK
ncbi:MAG: murein biosynthesis integral membrane protein MurJ [Candidatus Aminicenantes bacterium]|nr:murein biosynthesis integral membrane protein MurJ [Candidatus Aminicenantes bacterium]